MSRRVASKAGVTLVGARVQISRPIRIGIKVEFSTGVVGMKEAGM
jgi:hypothetical protein